MKDLFKPADIDRQALMLAYHMPIGNLWSSAFDGNSNLGKLVRGLGTEFYRLEVLLENIETQFNIDETFDFISEWERSVGLPNQCFSTDVNIEERREQVKQVFTNFGGVQEAEDFVRVAALFGHDITVIPGIRVGGFPLEFPMTFFGDTKDATHTIFIQINDDLSTGDDFPLPFPLPFSSGAEQFLLCIFNVLAPANVNVVTITEGQLP